jgi:hypothetical protein
VRAVSGRVHLQQVDDMPPHIEVWRSVRAPRRHQDQEVAPDTRPSPQAVAALKTHRTHQARPSGGRSAVAGDRPAWFSAPRSAPRWTLRTSGVGSGRS